MVEASNVLYKNSNHGRAVNTRCEACHLAIFYHQNSILLQVVHILHIGMKRKLLTKAESPNILVHMVAMYDTFQALLVFLCCRVL